MADTVRPITPATPPAEEAPAPPPAPPRAAFDVDWARSVRMGLLLGLGLVFVAATNILEGLNSRPIVVVSDEPILTLGWISMLWLPLVLGYQAAREDAPEGLAPPRKGVRDLIAGFLAGAIGGFMLWLLAVITDAFDLREVFRRLSPGLVEILTFGRGLGFALVALIVGSAVLGMAGGALAVVGPRARRAITGALSWTFIVAVIEPVFRDLFGDTLGFITDFFFAPNGGMTLIGALVALVGTGALSWTAAGRSNELRTKLRDTAQASRAYSLIAFGIVAVLVVVLPIFLGGIVNELLSNVGLFLLMALGLNIVVGYAGLLDLGYVAFFAVGAYTTAVLTSPIAPSRLAEGNTSAQVGLLTVNFTTWEGWVVLAIVLGVAAVAGLFVGTPVIRMRGDYLAIVTLGFGEIVRILFLSDWLKDVFGGAQGVRQIPAAIVDPPGADPTLISGVNPQYVLYFVAIFVAIAIYASWRLSRSRIGRAWSAMREDESVAEAMGIDTVKAKLLAFVTGAMLASFGGMVFAVKVGSVVPSSFDLLVSIIVLVVVIVGGMGSIPGVIVGALVLIGILGGPKQPGVLQEFGEFKLLIYGALLVYMMLQRPEGLLPSVSRSRELHHEEMQQDAWLASAIDAEEAETATTSLVGDGDT